MFREEEILNKNQENDSEIIQPEHFSEVVEELPASENPAAEIPDSETPVSENPVSQNQDDERPVNETHDSEVPFRKHSENNIDNPNFVRHVSSSVLSESTVLEMPDVAIER